MDSQVAAALRYITATQGGDAGTDKYVREHYPQFAHYLDHKELGPLLKKASKEKYSATKFEAELHKTDWWKTTSDAQRQAELLKKTDPASWQRLVSARRHDIDRMISELGFDAMSDWDVLGMTNDAVRYGWSENELRSVIGNKLRSTSIRLTTADGRYAGGVSTGGIISHNYNKLGEMQSDYLLAFASNDIEEFAIRLWEGSMTEDGIEAFFQSQATIAMPWLQDAIDNGVTPAQYFAPAKQKIGQILEINADGIDLRDDKWNEITSMVDDKGTRRSMTLTEVGNFARDKNEYKFTDGANERVNNMLTTLGETFGKVK